jgi:hypothetical protein
LETRCRLRKPIRAVELVDFAFEPADQDLLNVFLLAAFKLAGLCEAYRIQNFEQSGEPSRVAIVRRGCQTELVLKQWRDLPEGLNQLVVLAERRGEQIVSLIDDEKIPRRRGTVVRRRSGKIPQQLVAGRQVSAVCYPRRQREQRALGAAANRGEPRR